MYIYTHVHIHTYIHTYTGIKTLKTSYVDLFLYMENSRMAPSFRVGAEMETEAGLGEVSGEADVWKGGQMLLRL